MDSIDYYNRYAVPYYEETVDASMEEVMKPFVELLSEQQKTEDVTSEESQTPDDSTTPTPDPTQDAQEDEQ